MRNIRPFQIWFNGSMRTARIITASCVQDNLNNTAIFYWQLFELQADGVTQGQRLSEGNLSMTGADYVAYNSATDANLFAYNWIAARLGLTLI